MALVKKQNASWWYYEWDSSDFNLNKGITTWLDSSATEKPQPSGTMTAWDNKINGANPSSPSTNNATRREEYNIQTWWTSGDTNIPQYITTPGQVLTWTPETTWTSVIKEKTWSFSTEWWDAALEQIKKTYSELWIDGLKSVYWDAQAIAYEELLQNMYDRWSLVRWEMWILSTQSPNVRRIMDLQDEVDMALALWYKDAATIAEKLGQEEWVIQKILNNKWYELLELDEEFKRTQLRDYYWKEEDLGIEAARNMEDYRNWKSNADYQFNSTMKNLERQMFDAQWAAKWTAAGLGMTWTKYTLDRIRTQYQQAMDDVENTYQYQSATAQLWINRAIEDFAKNMERLWIEESEATKSLQSTVMETMINLDNQVWLTVKQQQTILANLQSNIAKLQADGTERLLKSIENWTTALTEQIANAYGLTDLTTHQFTSQELWRTSTSTIWNDTNNLWHILNSNDNIRIWTYKSANWYTYNVYATREDWLLATKELLKKWYYWKTLRQAAQKWIWQGKDISVAVSVMKGLWLNPDAVLSDDNVRQFMEAIWRWEGTIKKWETLDDWLKWWKNLWWTSGWAEGTWTYNSDYSKDYERYLTDWWDSFKSSTQEDLIKQFWSMDNFIKSAKAYSKAVVQPQQAKTFQDSLDLLVEFKNRWDELSDTQKALIKKLWTEWNLAQNWLYWSKVNSVINLYKQIKAQSFIDNIVASKKKWATYGPLSDNEWTKITDAANELNLNAPKDVNARLDEMMWDLAQAITELWYTPDITTWRQRNVWLVNTSTVFNQGWTAYGAGSMAWTNYTWAYQSGSVNTGAQQMW